MISSLRKLLIVIPVMALILFGSTMPARASQLNVPPQQGSNLAIDPVQPFVTGNHPDVTVHLTDQYGKPIPKQTITILIDGKRKARIQTDSRGIATMNLQFKLAAGTYNLVAIYPGIISIGVSPAVTQTKLVVEPAKLEIHTIPATPGVVFKLNNQTYTTDSSGAVTIQINTSGIYSLNVLPIDQKSLPSNVRMEFSRWNDNVFTANRQVYIPRDSHMEAGFTIKYQVTQIFHDTEGNLIDPARISSMVIKGSGEAFTFNKAGPIWLPANRLLRRISENLESDPILYYSNDVMVDGASVVNRGEQRFDIRPGDVWNVKILLYTINFSAQDAMFHFPIGKGIELTYPNGRTQQFSFNSPNAAITIPSLARGSYTARVIGAGGSAPLTPIHLSRDQDVQLLMLSYLDIAVIVGLPLLIALVFFFIGRPLWLRVLLHPSKFRELVYQDTQRDAS